jgi:hypothetical protein
MLTTTVRASFSSPLYKIRLYTTHLVWTHYPVSWTHPVSRPELLPTSVSNAWTHAVRYYVTLNVLESRSAGFAGCTMTHVPRTSSTDMPVATAKYLTQMVISRARGVYSIYCCNPVTCLHWWQLPISIRIGDNLQMDCLTPVSMQVLMIATQE